MTINRHVVVGCILAAYEKAEGEPMSHTRLLTVHKMDALELEKELDRISDCALDSEAQLSLWRADTITEVMGMLEGIRTKTTGLTLIQASTRAEMVAMTDFELVLQYKYWKRVEKSCTNTGE